MAKQCDVCGKSPQTGYHVSHSHVRAKRRWFPNLQQVRVRRAGKPVRLQVCTKCLKAGKVTQVG